MPQQFPKLSFEDGSRCALSHAVALWGASERRSITQPALTGCGLTNVAVDLFPMQSSSVHVRDLGVPPMSYAL